MIAILFILVTYNFLLTFVLASRVHKMNRHHHGGFTNNGLQFREKDNAC